MAATEATGAAAQCALRLSALRGSVFEGLETAQKWRNCRDNPVVGDIMNLTNTLLAKLNALRFAIEPLVLAAAREGGTTENERQVLAAGAAFVTATRWLPTQSTKQQTCQGYRAIDDAITCLQQMAIWLAPQD